MKIALIGGAGFIGSVLAEKLIEARHEVAILDLNPSEQFPDRSQIIDVQDLNALKDALSGFDIIYNLAAEHRDDVSPVEKYYNVNLGGAENIAAAARHNHIHTIIFTSTVAVYGLNAGESRESDTPSPFNDYGRSKLQAEEVLQKWQAEDPQHTLVIMRLVATFGPGNRGNIFTLMDQIARKRFVMVGDGRNKKSVAYVENVAAFLQHCLTFDAGCHLYNYADKPDLTMHEMVADIRHAFGFEGKGPQIPYAIGLAGGWTFDLAAQITGKTFPISTVRVQKFCANTVVSAEKLNDTGFERPCSLSEGLKAMIRSDFLSDDKKAA